MGLNVNVSLPNYATHAFGATDLQTLMFANINEFSLWQDDPLMRKNLKEMIQKRYKKFCFQERASGCFQDKQVCTRL